MIKEKSTYSIFTFSKSLQRQGMPRNLRAVVTYSIVISRVLYALPARGGFLSVELINKINSFLMFAAVWIY